VLVSATKAIERKKGLTPLSLLKFMCEQNSVSYLRELTKRLERWLPLLKK
jgi:hypothetical protein